MLVLTGPFTPMLFMGEEWAASTPWAFFTSHPDEQLGEATGQGRLEEFARMGWDPNLVPDPQAMSTFLDSKLDWAEARDRRSRRDAASCTGSLAALRRARPELTDPRFGHTTVEFDDDERWLLIDRSGVRIAVNFSDEITHRSRWRHRPDRCCWPPARRPSRAATSRPCRRTPPSSSHPPANDCAPAAGADRRMTPDIRWLFGDQLGPHFLDVGRSAGAA